MTLAHRTWRLGVVAAALLIAAAMISPVLAATISVSIVDRQFEPAEIVVAQGDTVIWTVTKAIAEPHTVTSGTADAADKGALFDSQKDDADLAKLKDVGGSYSFTFDKAGTYAYFCAIHAGMTGKVVVLAPGEAPTAHEGVPTENKIIGAVVLIVTLVVLFGAAAVYRRMNPA